MDPITNTKKDATAEDIEQDIIKTRQDMSGTVDEIGERLSAAHWRAVVQETISDKTRAAVSRGKQLANRAWDSTGDLRHTAGKTASNAADTAVQFLKDHPFSSRMGAFTIGLVAVLVWRVLQNRKIVRQRPVEGTEFAKARIFPIEEVERKVEQAALAPEQEFKKAA